MANRAAWTDALRIIAIVKQSLAMLTFAPSRLTIRSGDVPELEGVARGFMLAKERLTSPGLVTRWLARSIIRL
jgi:hypothetical protein